MAPTRPPARRAIWSRQRSSSIEKGKVAAGAPAARLGLRLWFVFFKLERKAICGCWLAAAAAPHASRACCACARVCGRRGGGGGCSRAIAIIGVIRAKAAALAVLERRCEASLCTLQAASRREFKKERRLKLGGRKRLGRSRGVGAGVRERSPPHRDVCPSPATARPPPWFRAFVASL